MIDLFGHPSQNVLKALIVLEELELDYRFVNDRVLQEGTPDHTAFRRASPTGQVPAIHDPETGVDLFESSAILIYLAEKGGRFLPTPEHPKARAETLKWLMFESASLTPPMLAIYHYTLQAEEEHPYAENRARTQVLRALDVLETHLQDGNAYLAGETYTIADIILYPWMAILDDFADIPLGTYPALEKWTARIGARKAVQKAETV